MTAAGKPASPADIAPVHADFVQRMLAYYRTDPAVREVPGATDVFRRLRAAGVKVALNTGFSRPIVDVILTRLGWEKAVDATAASDEVPRGRPHPDLVLHLMAKLGVMDAKRVAKVGDTVSDLEEGTSAGCGLVIGVTTGRTRGPSLRPGRTRTSSSRGGRAETGPSRDVGPHLLSVGLPKAWRHLGTYAAFARLSATGCAIAVVRVRVPAWKPWRPLGISRECGGMHSPLVMRGMHSRRSCSLPDTRP